MAKSDRTLTIEEVFTGHVSTEYLDLKEKLAVTERHIRKLSEELDAVEDGLTVFAADERHPNKDRLMQRQEELKAELDGLAEEADGLKKQMEETW